MKTAIIASITAIILLSAAFFTYYSIPHNSPILVSDAIRNAESYEDKTIMVRGIPVLLDRLDTPSGSIGFYALKDESGQIPVVNNAPGFSFFVKDNYNLNSKIAVVGTLGQVCVHGIYNKTSEQWSCDKKELGIVT